MRAAGGLAAHDGAEVEGLGDLEGLLNISDAAIKAENGGRMTSYKPKPCAQCPHSMMAHYTQVNEKELHIVCAVCQNSGNSPPCRVIPLTVSFRRR